MAASFFGAPPGMYPRSLYTNPLLMSPDKLFALHGYPKKEEVKSESGDSSPGEFDDETKSSISFLRAPSSHTTPSPKHISPFSSGFPLPASPVGTNAPYSPPITSGGIFFPPQLSPSRVLFTPTTKAVTPMFPTWPPTRLPFGDMLCGPTPRTPLGGDLLLCSPTVGGVAVEQEAPIDLSVNTSMSYRPPTPRSDHEDDDSESEELTIDVCSDSISIKNNPLDLTAKRVQVP